MNKKCKLTVVATIITRPVYRPVRQNLQVFVLDVHLYLPCRSRNVRQVRTSLTSCRTVIRYRLCTVQSEHVLRGRQHQIVAMLLVDVVVVVVVAVMLMSGFALYRR